ncbi:MAG: FkbM family methyltransferase [Solirubrobacteraceae bacterium]
MSIRRERLVARGGAGIGACVWYHVAGMHIGGRAASRVLRAPLEPGHWRALAGMARVYPHADLPATLWRFASHRGRYPRMVEVRTPTGPVTVTLDSSHDLSTVNEIFARRDYAAGTNLGVAVDVGANIGIASLYFLSRNQSSRVYCVEPEHKNLARMRYTLAPYAGRWSVQEVAADVRDGEAEFFVEPTGRYGGLVKHWKSESIRVPTRRLTTMLDEVLEREQRIDVLKVDTEGSEEELIGAIRPDQLDRIHTIYYETNDPEPMHTDRYEHRFSCQTNALIRRAG